MTAKVGDLVAVRAGVGSQKMLKGTVRFVGQTQFKPGVVWCGVELDTRDGKNDGAVAGVRYFQCPDGFGLFVLHSKVTPLQPPAVRQKSP